MALNPVAYTENVVRSFLRYQLTAYPFSDPRLHAQMRALLSLDETRRSPLLKGPYVSLSRPFREGAAVAALVGEDLLHPHLADRIPAEITHLYSHQEHAIRAIAEGRTTLVSTGTGSGKTECFLYPVVSRCLALRDEGAPPGISAVIVYPMNALAEDQLMRLRGLLAGTGIPFGIYVGKTPEREVDVAGVKLPPGSSRADYEARLARARRDGSGGNGLSGRRGLFPGGHAHGRAAAADPAHQRQAARAAPHPAAGHRALLRRASRLPGVRRSAYVHGRARSGDRVPHPTPSGLVRRGGRPYDLRRNLGHHRRSPGPRRRARLRIAVLRRRTRFGGDGRRRLRGRGLDGGTPGRSAAARRGPRHHPRSLCRSGGGRGRCRGGGAGSV